jgi:hypothetical protein
MKSPQYLGLSLVWVWCTLLQSCLVDSVAGKASVKGFYFARRDRRKCAIPLCGGFYVRQVDGSKFRCPRKGKKGAKVNECYVTSIDWSDLGLSSDDEKKKLQKLLLKDQALVQGKITLEKASKSTFGRRLGLLTAKEGYLAATKRESTGEFYSIVSNGITCITTPCFSMDKYTLDGKQVTSISELDLSRVKATEQQLEQAYQAIAKDGLVVVGQNQNVTGVDNEGVTFEASQFYLRVETNETKTED